MKRRPQKTKKCPVDADWLVSHGWRWDTMSFTASIPFKGVYVMRNSAATWIRSEGRFTIHIKHVETVGDAIRLHETLGIDLVGEG